MADEKDKHTPESVAVKVVKALLKVSPQNKKRKETQTQAANTQQGERTK